MTHTEAENRCEGVALVPQQWVHVKTTLTQVIWAALLTWEHRCRPLSAWKYLFLYVNHCGTKLVSQWAFYSVPEKVRSTEPWGGHWSSQLQEYQPIKRSILISMQYVMVLSGSCYKDQTNDTEPADLHRAPVHHIHLFQPLHMTHGSALQLFRKSDTLCCICRR